MLVASDQRQICLNTNACINGDKNIISNVTDLNSNLSNRYEMLYIVNTMQYNGREIVVKLTGDMKNL